ncbi:MAG TPA: RHS repeat-associated core domain-containing protein, partial [Gemmatimonadaceae bacterium]|nr:RHS repeat-associated core domain-containing protein [Gemmatimonadaceae bacterium]
SCTSTKDYAYRGGALLGAATTAGTHYYTLDHLGTPRVVTDQNGFLVAEHTYFPFGVEITDQSPTDGPLRFTGHERDADILAAPSGALDYMHARYYSAFAGRFLSTDPGNDSDPREPQSWNLYSYVRNDPVNATDPTGRAVEIAAASNVSKVKDYLTRLAMRPDGRAALMKVAGDSNFLLRIETGTLTFPAKVKFDMETKGKSDVKFGQTVPTGTVQIGSSGTGTFVATGATMTFDATMIAAHHPDNSGVTTAAHEFYHNNDIMSGLLGDALQAGDTPTPATGPAEAEGQRVAGQQPDVSAETARKLVDSIVRVKK